MNEQLGFVFNADYCIGCRSCEIACLNENNINGHVSWRMVTKVFPDTYLSLSCNHCSSPECFRVCPENAFAKRADGIVVVDSNRCNGCGLCVEACPYDAPQLDYETNRVSKCQMCYHRQDKGLLPACVESCPTGSLNIANLFHFRDPQLRSSIKGFPEIRLTQPSIVFYPPRKKTSHFLRD